MNTSHATVPDTRALPARDYLGRNCQALKRAVLEVLRKSLPRPAYRALHHAKDGMKILRAYLFYRGQRRTCCMCGRRARRFLPVGCSFPVLRELHVIGGMRVEEGECPFCFSHCRERLVYQYLTQRTGILTQRMKVLHFAPERNIRAILQGARNLAYVTADIDSSWADEKIDVTAIPYADNSFDAILCNHVLEHVADDRKAMAELYRILKPGGWALLQVPISTVLEKTVEDILETRASERERRFGQHDHLRIYARDYADRLRATGAAVRTVNCLATFGEAAAAEYGLIPEEDLYFMEKPAAGGGVA